MRGAPVEALQRVPLFADLSKREVQKIARLFKKRRFSKGETIVKEGSGGAAFFVIESGEAAVFIGGKQRTTLKPGDYFGEIALIDEGTAWRRSPPPANSLVMGLPTGTSALSWRRTAWSAGNCCNGWRRCYALRGKRPMNSKTHSAYCATNSLKTWRRARSRVVVLA